MDEILSVTGREVPRITLTREDRHALWVYLYPVMALLPAVREQDWLLVAFWVVNIAGFLAMARFGQPKESRTNLQKVFLIMLFAVSAGFVLIPGRHAVTSRLVGLGIETIPFIADIVLARRARAGA